MIRKSFKCLLVALVGMLPITGNALVHKKKHASHKTDVKCKQDSCVPHKSKDCLDEKFCRVDVANTDVGSKGTVVLDKVSKQLFYSDGCNWVPLANAVPAPAVITVDPALCPNGVTKFNTIQEAINSLGNKKIVDTTITIAKGVYPENLVVQSILNSDTTKLKINGDLRQIVGCGIAHDVFWNAQAVPGPVGGGTGSKAVLSAVGSTLTVTASVGTSPNFVLAGVVPGDKVVIRNDAGASNIYTVAFGGVTPTTLTFSDGPIVGTVGALGSAMCVAPNVAIAPAAGDVITHSSMATFQGLFLVTPAGANGFRALELSGAILSNILTFDGARGIVATGPIAPSIANTAFSYIAVDSPFGVTVMGATTSGITSDSSAVHPRNSLIAPAPSAGTSLGLNEFSIAKCNNAKFIGNIVLQSNSLFTLGFPAVIISTGGTALNCTLHSYVELAGIATLTIRGAPLVGVQVSGNSFLNTAATLPLSFSSTANGFIGLTLGSGGLTQDANTAYVNFADITVPASATAYIAQVNNGSTLVVGGVSGTNSIGANSNGFLVTNDSKLIWRGGNVAGNAASATGVLFDIRRNSSMTILPAANATFTNYPTLFNFDDNSRGDLNDITCTTTTGGVNLTATNMSRVELGTTTFNLSGANVGINTAPNGNVEKRSGAVFTNSASLPISAGSCTQLFTDAIGGYTCTKGTGLIVVSP